MINEAALDPPHLSLANTHMYETRNPAAAIKYPSYKALDDFIDVERLKSLDAYVTERLMKRRHYGADLKFYTGPFRLNDEAPERPGSRMVYLKQSSQPDSYFDLDKTELWLPAPASSEFSQLMDFIATLPFESTGRTLIMYDDSGHAVPAHRDHSEVEVCHEFIWFRTNLKKPFFMLDPRANEKQYVQSYTAWFDSVNQFHGSDESEGLTFSIRVDGVFTRDFRKLIPALETNRAATPSAWAQVERQQSWSNRTF